MSLDVSLIGDGGEEIFSANLTGNLIEMASQAGIYDALWRPQDIGITTASQMIEPLTSGLHELSSNQAKYERFNSPVGWGKWDDLVPWCSAYLEACRNNPGAKVEAIS